LATIPHQFLAIGKIVEKFSEKICRKMLNIVAENPQFGRI